MAQTDNWHRPRVGLALGGGVARSLAHVGVLSVLVREGIPIDLITGTSGGALVGGLYAATHDIARARELALQTGWGAIARPAWPVRGLISFKRMERWIAGLIGDLTFADLKVPFAAMTTDLERAEPVLLRTGRLAPAVHASCAVPGVVVPVELDGRLLGDGALVDNVPVAAARELGADVVIAVDIMTPKLRRRLGPLGFGYMAFESLVRNTGGGRCQADVLITPALAGISYIWFGNRARLIALGEQAAEGQLPAIRKLLPINRGER
jgi:NTE family protein